MAAELTVRPLSDQERQHLTDYEATIQRGIHAFIEVGTALYAIRDAKLYRESYKTFDAYCKDRWQLGRNYAYKLIGASQVVGNLAASPTVSVLPTKESQVRPLAALPPEQQVEAWTEAEAVAPNGKPTGAIVANVVLRRFPRKLHSPSPEVLPETGSQAAARTADNPHGAFRTLENHQQRAYERVLADVYAWRSSGFLALDPAAVRAATEDTDWQKEAARLQDVIAWLQVFADEPTIHEGDTPEEVGTFTAFRRVIRAAHDLQQAVLDVKRQGYEVPTLFDIAKVVLPTAAEQRRAGATKAALEADRKSIDDLIPWLQQYLEAT